VCPVGRVGTARRSFFIQIHLFNKTESLLTNLRVDGTSGGAARGGTIGNGLLSGCDGDFCYASLHTGATAWHIMASLTVNPFVPGV
jgi:hypothetical protein